jgi:predicted AAA+ superfamily ATPase
LLNISHAIIDFNLQNHYNLNMEKTYERLIENQIRDMFDELPAISIDGLKGIGKTVSGRRIANTVYELDQIYDFEVISNDVNILSTAAPPVLIDEWQKISSVWDYVRRCVDKGAIPGNYLLTGSIANSDVNIHSGAGRIIKIKMFPLSLQERISNYPTVSLGRLLNSEVPFTEEIKGRTEFGFVDYVNEIVMSGLPGLRKYSPRRRHAMIGSYVDNLLSHEFKQQGVKIRQPQTLLRWLKAYAAAVSTDAGYSEILDASTAGEGSKPAANTTISYREALTNLWLIDELQAWLDGEDYFSRLKRTPKHYLADPAIAAYLLNFDSAILSGRSNAQKPTTGFDEKYGSITGRLFESLVQLSLNTYSAANEATLSYLATRNGDHEVDFIVQRENSVVAIEVKLAQTITDSDVRHLLWFKKNIGNRLSDAIIITTGPIAYRRPDGIAVVPAALLGA